MSRFKSYLGFVLKKKALKDKDLLVYLFTKESGKLLVIAKGVRKITSRRLSHIDTGNLIKAYIAEKNDFNYLSQTELVSGFSSIKSDAERIKIFFEVLKFLDEHLVENQPEEELFFYFLSALKDLSEDKFELECFKERVLEILGFK